MKLAARQAVEGTEPVVHIGHRVYTCSRTGKSKVCKPWYAEYCVAGRRQYEALKTTNKNVALRKAFAIAKRIAGGQIKAPNYRTTLKQLTERYMQRQRNQNRRPKTVEKYDLVMRRLVAWSADDGRRLAASFTADNYWDFIASMRDAGLSEKTCYDRGIVIRQMFRWATREKLVPEFPFTGISTRKPARTLQPCFQPEQVEALLERAPADLRPIFALMAYTGMRFGEVRDLCWDDIQMNSGAHGVIIVQRGGSQAGATKSGRSRRIPIHQELRAIFDSLQHVSDRVFVERPAADEAPEKPLAERKLLKALKRLCTECGFVNPNQYKLHTFRHAFASMLARNNTSYKYALEFMGHQSSEILDHYYTVYDKTAEAAIATIDYAAGAASRPPKVA